MYSHFDFTGWVTPFGLIFLGAVAAAWCLARRNASSINIHGSHIDLLIPLSIIVGVAGGAALSLAMPKDRMIAGELMQTGVRIRLFGMLATSALAIFIYSRLAGLPFRRLLDVFALPTLAGLMLHRIACFLAGCCWGDVISHVPATRYATQIETLPFLAGLSRGVQYPPDSLPYEQHLALGLIGPGAPASLPVYPVQVYESVLLFICLVAFSRLPWRRFEKGLLTILVVCTYAIMRFFLEYLRADGAIVIGNLTVTQLQCLVLLVSAALLPRMLRADRKQRLA